MSRMTKRTATNKIVVHCSASTTQADWGAADIRRIHVADNGWDDIGYHYVICRDGTIEYGRHRSYSGAHAPQANSSSIGICLVGGADHDSRGKLVSAYNYTTEQLVSLSRLIKLIQEEYPDAKEVLGHVDVGGTKDCPCFNVAHWWETGEIEQITGREW